MFLSENFSEPPILYSTHNSTYDYRYACRDSIESFKKLMPVYDSKTSENLLSSFASQFQYELYKDLYRLSITTCDTDKAVIIKRLLAFTKYSKKDFLSIINSNIQNEKIKLTKQNSKFARGRWNAVWSLNTFCILHCHFSF